MSAAVGQRVELARYVTSSGERVLFGQRIDGIVPVTDRPSGDTGRAFLVERGPTCKAELDALVVDYVEQSERRDEPAVLVRVGDDLAGWLGSDGPEVRHVCRRGDELAEYFSRHATRLERIVAANVAASGATVEDACSFAWCPLARRTDIRLDDWAVGWLYRVAVHEAWGLAAIEQRTVSYSPGLDDLHHDRVVLEPASRASVHDAVNARLRLATVGALPERQQRILLLFAFGFTYAEIANVTGDSPPDRRPPAASREAAPQGRVLRRRTSERARRARASARHRGRRVRRWLTPPAPVRRAATRGFARRARARP